MNSMPSQLRKTAPKFNLKMITDCKISLIVLTSLLESLFFLLGHNLSRFSAVSQKPYHFLKTCHRLILWYISTSVFD